MANSKNNSSLPQLTHPDRILYPEAGVTKLDLAEYYLSISKWILPYIIKRPLTLVRCPKGHLQKGFYQKHLKETVPVGIYPISILEKKSGGKEYIYIKDAQGLLGLVQLAVLEIHPWACRIDDVEKPDMIIFDLDPAPDVSWSETIDAALLLREQLKDLELKSFVKTTGGKGLHVIIPIKRLYSWEDIKIFAETFVNYIVSQFPQKYIGTMSKAKRVGKIFIDHLRNRRGATAIAPFSTRARHGAPVATPLAWQELKEVKAGNYFTIHNIPKRLKSLTKDPWQDFLALRQTLPFK